MACLRVSFALVDGSFILVLEMAEARPIFLALPVSCSLVGCDTTRQGNNNVVVDGDKGIFPAECFRVISGWRLHQGLHLQTFFRIPQSQMFSCKLLYVFLDALLSWLHGSHYTALHVRRSL